MGAGAWEREVGLVRLYDPRHVGDALKCGEGGDRRRCISGPRMSGVA